MRPWQCGGGAIICFCLGVGLLLSLLFTSEVILAALGIGLLLCGLLWAQKRVC